MDVQLTRTQAELGEARRRAHAVADPLSDGVWSARPAPGAWSVAECLIHLNLTTRAFVPLIEQAIATGRAAPGPRAGHRMGWIGRLTWVMATLNVPVNTTERFVPAGLEPKGSVLTEFDTLQDRLAGCLVRADGLDLGGLRVVSPFDGRLAYSLYAAFRLIPAHQRQHLRQAERVVRKLT